MNVDKRINPRSEGQHRGRKILEMIFDKLDTGPRGWLSTKKQNRLPLRQAVVRKDSVG
jgi:hypothetical protein